MKKIALVCLLLLSTFLFSGCSSGGGTGDTGSNSGGTPGPSLSQTATAGTVQPAPGDSTASGQHQNATVYAVGQQQNSVQTDSNGNFLLPVDPTLSNVVLAGPSFKKVPAAPKLYGLIVWSASHSHGRKIEVSITEGQTSSIPTIYVSKVGSISGKAFLQNATDHTGITVFIPGTSFMAMTAADGSYTISNVPEGTYDFVRADKQGSTYGYAVLSSVTVNSGADTSVPDMLLQLSPGANGSILINQGAATTTSMTVNLSIATSSNAVLMQVSEDSDFTNHLWEPVQASKIYTFVTSTIYSTGATATIYAKFADASGLASSPITASIYINTAPRATLIAPRAVIANTKPTLQWDYPRQLHNLSFHVQLSDGSAFTNIIEDQTVSQPTYTVTTTLSNLATYWWRVAIIDDAGNDWGWAGSSSFQVDLRTVTLDAPANNMSTNDSTPQFTWQPNTDAASYRFTLSTGNDLSAPVAGYDNLSLTNGSCALTVASLGTTTSQQYSWAVTPVDGNGVEGTRSEIRHFTFDTVAPVVNIVSTETNSQVVPIGTAIAITFSEPVDPGTVNTLSIEVSDGAAVPGAFSFTNNNATAVFTPNPKLDYTTNYSITIHTSVKDLAGNSLAADVSSAFLTRPAPGSLDHSFGIENNGKVPTDFGNGLERLWALALQGDGKIIAAGESNGDFALARYTSAGILDTTFVMSGTTGTGTITTAFAGDTSAAYSLGLQPDGKIVAAGWANNGSRNYYAVARYKATGKLDSFGTNSFAGTGKITTDIAGIDNSSWSNTLVIQQDGKIVLSGYFTDVYTDPTDTSITNQEDHIALVRYNTDGSIDTGYGVNGIVKTSVGSNDYVMSMGVQTDGRIVIAGYYDTGIFLVRYNPDGTPDPNFGSDSNGKVVMNDPNFEWRYIYSLVLQSDGKILVAGCSKSKTTSESGFLLIRYDSTGHLDTGFGIGGMEHTDVVTGNYDETAYAIAVQPDGKIVIAGYSMNAVSGYYDIVLLRYNKNGGLDTTFDLDGKLTTPVDTMNGWGYGDGKARAVIIQSDGKIVVGGSATYESDVDDDFVLLRYWP